MKKGLAILLALFMVLTLVFTLASCGTTPEETTGSSATVDSTGTGKTETSSTASGSVSTTSGSETSATATTATSGSTGSDVTTDELDGFSKHPEFMDVNFGGKTFTFATEANATGWEVYEFYAEATGDDDLVAEGVMRRNAVVEQLYNCKIVEEKVAGAAGAIANDVALGQFHYDYCLYEYSALSYGGNWLNIAAMDIDLSHSWWDQAFIDTFCIPVDGVNRMYTLAGKCNVRMMDAIWALFFNKRLYDQLVSSGKITVDIYEEVIAGRWTIDMMLEMMEAASKDANGDQKFAYSDGDIMGCMTNANNYMLKALFFCSGNKSVIKDPMTGLPCSMSPENTDIASVSSAIDKAIEIWRSPYFQTAARADVVAAMTNGGALFTSEVLGTVISVVDEDAYYSIVPFPKTTASQDDYAQYVCNRAYGMKVPTSTTDRNVSAQFLEVFGFHSEKILYPAYISYYTTQCFCDETAAEMLQIVIDTRVYDLGVFSGSTQIIGKIEGMIPTANNNFSRMVANTAKTDNNTLGTYIDNLRKQP